VRFRDIVTRIASAARTRPRATDKAPGRSPTRAAGDDRLVIGYTPDRDGEADPGEVVWTWVPYEDDPSQGKDRPVVVIGTAGRLLAVVPLSSKDHPGKVEVGSGAWDSAGRPSYADVDRVLRVAPGDVRREGATLGRRQFDDVVAGVRRRHADLG
jgi:PemK-like, MazF-like toxin of type II toxin-antitoxin system